MKYGVTKNTLLITAGIVWLLAGINILRIGISCWINDSHYWFFKVCEATIVFLLFFGLIFHKLYKKHTHRISQKKAKNCPFSFFDVKGWIIMVIHDYHRYFNTHPAFTTGSIHCCILYRIVSSPNYNWYPIYIGTGGETGIY